MACQSTKPSWEAVQAALVGPDDKVRKEAIRHLMCHYRRAAPGAVGGWTRRCAGQSGAGPGKTQRRAGLCTCAAHGMRNEMACERKRFLIPSWIALKPHAR